MLLLGGALCIAAPGGRSFRLGSHVRTPARASARGRPEAPRCPPRSAGRPHEARGPANSGRVALAVKVDEPADPPDVGPLRAAAVVARPDRPAHPVEQARGAGRSRVAGEDVANHLGRVRPGSRRHVRGSNQCAGLPGSDGRRSIGTAPARVNVEAILVRRGDQSSLHTLDTSPGLTGASQPVGGRCVPRRSP